MRDLHIRQEEEKKEAKKAKSNALENFIRKQRANPASQIDAVEEQVMNEEQLGELVVQWLQAESARSSI